MLTPTIFEKLIPAKHVRSLVWRADSLVDWVAAGTVYQLDGSCQPGQSGYPYTFDAAVDAPRTGFSVIYTRTATKALLLKNGLMVRELNRSFYRASNYEYPVCLLQHEGRPLLVHCPDHYNKLEIEDAQTGERLTLRTSMPTGFFHSRLSANPSGTRLLSAGWVWTPVDVVAYWDIAEALRHPDHLNRTDWCPPHSFVFGLAEIASACWQTDTNVILTACKEPEEPEFAEEADTETERRLRPCGIAVHDTSTGKMLFSCVLEEPAGTVMPVGETHVVAFFNHPRLIRLADGAVEHAWPAISSGTQLSSICCPDPLPPLSLDPANSRFAVAQEDGIHVISLLGMGATASTAAL
jgi:hypothetical protein